MTDPLMPDLVDAVERRLREHAVRRQKARSRTPPLALAAALGAAVACLVVALAARTGDRGPSTPALGAGPPLILRTAAVSAPAIIRQLERGGSVAAVLGAGARLDEARPVRAFGNTGYVLSGPRGLCLTLPDPSLPTRGDAYRSSGVTCRRTADVYRTGMILAVGQRVLAVVPRGARNPTLTSRNGQTKELRPTEQGVVAVEDGPAGWLFTVYGRDGSRSSLRIQRTRPVVSPAEHARRQKQKREATP